ncbi:MAG: hypothetical protein ABGX16_13320 [Pirellulales bacterium]
MIWQHAFGRSFHSSLPVLFPTGTLCRERKGRKSSTGKGKASCDPNFRRLRMEPLENRWLLSITVNTLADELDGSLLDGDISSVMPSLRLQRVK